jgi:phage shock protein A
MELSTLLFWLVIIVVVVALALSGKLRALLTAFFNLFVEDMAATPEGAEALFNQKIEEVEDKFRRADNVYKKIAGQRKRCKDELVVLQNQLSVIEKDCETLAKAQDEEGLDIKIQHRADTIEDIEAHKRTLTSLEAALKDATEARNACEENLNNIKKQRKQVVNKMKHDRDMKAVYDDLEGIGAGDHTSKLLDKVIERGTELEDLVAGSKEAYETKTSTRARKLDQKLKSSANDDYKAQLLNKYKK